MRGGATDADDVYMYVMKFFVYLFLSEEIIILDIAVFMTVIEYIYLWN